MSEKPFIPIESRGLEEPRNRAYDRRRDDDSVLRTPKITIYDIDYAILYHLQKLGESSIVDNGSIIDVPVVIANGEKWNQVQKDGYLRDSSKRIQSPIMILNRNSISPDDRISQLDVPKDNDKNKIKLIPKRSFTDPYDRFSKIQNSKKPDEFFLQVLPEFITVSYTLIIWTDYIKQLNKIVEDITPTSGFPWGETWQFVTEVESYDFSVDVGTDTERVVKCELGLTTRGFLLSDFEMKESTIQKAFSIKRVNFSNERSSFSVFLNKDALKDDFI